MTDHYDPMENSLLPEAQRIVAMRRAFFARCDAPPPPGLNKKQGGIYNRGMAQAEAFLTAGRIDLYRNVMAAAQAYLADPSDENAERLETADR